MSMLRERVARLALLLPVLAATFAVARPAAAAPLVLTPAPSGQAASPPAAPPAPPRVLGLLPARPTPGSPVAVVLAVPGGVQPLLARPLWQRRGTDGAASSAPWQTLVAGPRRGGVATWLWFGRVPASARAGTALAVAVGTARGGLRTSAAVPVSLATAPAPALPEAPYAALIPAALLAAVAVARPRRRGR